MNHIDELSEYYRIWSREYSSDKIYKFTTPDVALKVLERSAWLPELSSYGRISATDKTVLTTFSYNVTTSIVFKSDLFQYLDYLKAFSEIAEQDFWTSNGKIFTDSSMMPWESELYSLKPVPIDYIEEVVVYLRTPVGLVPWDIVLLRNKCKDLGIRFTVRRIEITDALAIPCACELFNKVYYAAYHGCECQDLIYVENYPKRITQYCSPLFFDFCWLVDSEHGFEHPEPDYEYGSDLSNEVTKCVERYYDEYYVVCLRSIPKRITKSEIMIWQLKRKINELFSTFWEIYFGKIPFMVWSV